MSPDAIFGWLEGEWSFVRVVRGQAQMTGSARVVVQGAQTALYAERATVQLVEGGVLRGERRYVYRAEPSGFDVLFERTGAVFQGLRFKEDAEGDLCAEATHACEGDVYRSTYRVRAGGGFEVEHVVLGPRKDYAMRTVYRRESAF